MDKAEFISKLEQIHVLADAGSYREAAEMADEIDWKRVKSVRTLSLIGEIYEHEARYEESRDIMKLAYRRSSSSKTVLYKLAELDIMTENIDEAKKFLNEFEQNSPSDTSRFILRYKLLRAERAPLDDQIAVLKEYQEHEYTEKWSYELARLYRKNGQKEKCIEECDDMILWFSEGEYVTKAMELKMQLKPLSPDQQVRYEAAVRKAAEERARKKIEAENLQAAKAREAARKKQEHLQAILEEAEDGADVAEAEGRGGPEADDIAVGSGIDAAVLEAVRQEEAREDAEAPAEEDEEGGRKSPGHPAGDKAVLELQEANINRKTSAEKIQNRIVSGIRAVFAGIRGNGFAEEEEDDNEAAGGTPVEDEDSDIRIASPLGHQTGTYSFAEEELPAESTRGQAAEPVPQPAIEELTEQALPVEETAEPQVRDLEPESIAAGSVIRFPEPEKTQQSSLQKTPEELEGEEIDKVLKEPRMKELDLDALFAETAGMFASEVASGHYRMADTIIDDDDPGQALPQNAADFTEQVRAAALAAGLPGSAMDEESGELAGEMQKIGSLSAEAVAEAGKTRAGADTPAAAGSTAAAPGAGSFEEVPLEEEDFTEVEPGSAIFEEVPREEGSSTQATSGSAIFGEVPPEEESFTEVEPGSGIFGEVPSTEGSSAEVKPGSNIFGEATLEEEGFRGKEASPSEGDLTPHKATTGSPVPGSGIEAATANGGSPEWPEGEGTAVEDSATAEADPLLEDSFEDGFEECFTEVEPAPGAEKAVADVEPPVEVLPERQMEALLDTGTGTEAADEESIDEIAEAVRLTAEQVVQEAAAERTAAAEEAKRTLESEGTGTGAIPAAGAAEAGAEAEAILATGAAQAGAGVVPATGAAQAGAGVVPAAGAAKAGAEVAPAARAEALPAAEAVETGAGVIPAAGAVEAGAEALLAAGAVEAGAEVLPEAAEEAEQKEAAVDPETRMIERETDESLGLTREFNFRQEIEKALEQRRNRRLMEGGEENRTPLRSPEEAASAQVEEAVARAADASPAQAEAHPLEQPDYAAARKQEPEGEIIPAVMSGVAVADLDRSLYADSDDVPGASDIEEEDVMELLPREGRPFTAAEIRAFSYFATIPGIDYQATAAIADIHNQSGDRTSARGNVAITGRPGSGKTRLADALILSCCLNLGLKAAKVGKIVSDKFNQKDPATVVKRLAGGFLLIEAAGALSRSAVERLNRAMEFRTDSLVVILEDEKRDLDALFEQYPAFAEKFTSHISVPIFTNDELVAFGKVYAQETGYVMDEMATLALYTMIGDNQKEAEPVTVGMVRQMVDKAIDRNSRGFRIGRSAEKEGGLTMLHEKDFNF